MPALRGCLCLALAATSALFAQSKPPASESERTSGEKFVRTDRFGDPLPDGAIARLGTLRLRHGRTLTSVAFSSDGKTLFSAGGIGDGSIGLWDPTTGKERKRIPVDWGLSLVIFPDGKTLAAATSRNRICVWDASTGKVVRTLKGHTDEPNHLALSADGKVLASSGFDKSIRIWDTGIGAERRTIQTGFSRTTYIESLAISPDGKTILGGIQPHYIENATYLQAWEASTGRRIRTFRGEHDVGNAVAISPDGKVVASAGGDGIIGLWAMESGKPVRVCRGKRDAVHALAFSPDGAKLASGHEDGRVRLWDVATGKEQTTLRGHRGPVTCVSFMPSGKAIASGGKDRTIRLWDLAKEKERFPNPGHQNGLESVAFTPDGRVVVTASADGTLGLWEASSARLQRLCEGHEGAVHSVAVSADGNTLASAGEDKTIRLWEAATGKPLARTPPGEYAVQAVLFGNDCKSVLSFDRPRFCFLCSVWDAKTGKPLRRLKDVDRSGITAFALSPDGKVLASGHRGAVGFWDLSTDKGVIRLEDGGKEYVSSLAFSPMGDTLAVGYFDGIVRIWQLSTGRLLHKVQANRNHSTVVAFSPDGRVIASGGRDGSVCLWEVSTGGRRIRLLGHRGPVTSLAFAPSGAALASASEDTTALLWAVAGTTRGGPERLTLEQMEEAWAALGGGDAARAYEAIIAWVYAPVQAVPFLGKRVRPATAVDAKRLARLVAEFDSDQFAARESAYEELIKVGRSAEPVLRRALAGQPSVEASRRIRKLLEKLESGVLSPDELRALRAVEILEHIGRPEAKKLLQDLAGGAFEARLTQEAKATLERMGKRPSAKP
jgi:WD40 repeat protein